MNDTSDKKDVCNAPCIINATGKYSIVFCQLEHGHGGIHLCEIEGSLDGVQASVAWSYTGEHGHGGISGARELTERCEEWMFPKEGVSRFRDSETYHGKPVVLMDVRSDQVGYCCEKDPGHKGWHERSGTFGPLGLDWKIMWSNPDG